jgi:hypothetical protein
MRFLQKDELVCTRKEIPRRHDAVSVAKGVPNGGSDSSTKLKTALAGL